MQILTEHAELDAALALHVCAEPKRLAAVKLAQARIFQARRLGNNRLKARVSGGKNAQRVGAGGRGIQRVAVREGIAGSHCAYAGTAGREARAVLRAIKLVGGPERRIFYFKVLNVRLGKHKGALSFRARGKRRSVPRRGVLKGARCGAAGRSEERAGAGTRHQGGGGGAAKPVTGSPAHDARHDADA